MKTIKIIVLVFILIFSSKELVYGEECKYGSIFSTEIYNWAVISKYCNGLNTAWREYPWVFEELDVNTGTYNTIGFFDPSNCDINTRPVIDLQNKIAFFFSRDSFNINIVSISNGKILGQLKPDISTDINSIRNWMINPDGSRLLIAWENGKDLTPTIEIFDTKTYKLTNKLTTIPINGLINAGLSNDGGSLYETDWLINQSTGNWISLKIWNKVHCEGNIEFNNKVLAYNLQTGKKFITTLSALPEQRNYLPGLSPTNEWLVRDSCKVNSLDIYNVNTEKKVTGLTISSSTNKGSVLSWPNDHTFIYNTTQQLIYFDIKQNKVIKELPIVRPWEQVGWKPEVGK